MQEDVLLTKFAQERKGAITQLIPSCLKTCLHVFLSKNMFFMSSCLKNVFLSAMQISYKE